MADRPEAGGQGWFSGLKEAAQVLGEAAARAAASAGELIADKELRRKGAAFIASEASKGIHELQKGFEAGADTIARSAMDRLSSSSRGVHGLLKNLERQISEFHRQQTLRDLATELEHHRKLPVDIQIGGQVYEDMPQELRTRLWAALLHHPDLGQPFRPLTGGGPDGGGDIPALQQEPTSPSAALAGAAPAAEGGEAADTASREEGGEAHALQGEPSFNVGSSEAGAVPRRASSAPVGAASAVGDDEGTAPSGSAPVASPSRPLHASTVGIGVAAPPQQEGNAAALAGSRGGSGGSSSLLQSAFHELSQRPPSHVTRQASPGAVRARHPGLWLPQPNHAAVDEWELVAEETVPVLSHSGEVEALETVRSIVKTLSMPSSANEHDQLRASKQALFEAMLDVPWVTGEGYPPAVDPEGEYARMLAQQEAEVEATRASGRGETVCDVIERDIHRTFPEHPLFSWRGEAGDAGDVEGLNCGQQKLLRVLRAYAARDPEVGYCQGMAFAAGILLMYLPEEAAYTLYCRLMGTEGCHLRRLYLPGLDPLKAELSRFELLLSTHLPRLHTHLLDAGLPAVLYASQWLMTAFAAPFPVHFASRVIDVMLLDMSHDILPRLALAIMGALEEELLALDDFEALITLLKVGPLTWRLHTYRRVFAAALSSPASDTELRAASAAVAAEAVRLGRDPSFRNSRLARRDTPGGGSFHELQMLQAQASSGPLGTALSSLGQPTSLGNPPEASAAGTQGRASLDAEFLDMMVEMRLLLPHGSETEGDDVDEAVLPSLQAASPAVQGSSSPPSTADPQRLDAPVQ